MVSCEKHVCPGQRRAKKGRRVFWGKIFDEKTASPFASAEMAMSKKGRWIFLEKISKEKNWSLAFASAEIAEMVLSIKKSSGVSQIFPGTPSIRNTPKT